MRYSAVIDAQGIKQEIQDHFLCKLETMIGKEKGKNSLFVALRLNCPWKYMKSV